MQVNEIKEARWLRSGGALVDPSLQKEGCEGARILRSCFGGVGIEVRGALIGDDKGYAQGSGWLRRCAIGVGTSDGRRFVRVQAPHMKFWEAVCNGIEIGVEQDEVPLGRIRVVSEVG